MPYLSATSGPLRRAVGRSLALYFGLLASCFLWLLPASSAQQRFTPLPAPPPSCSGNPGVYNALGQVVSTLYQGPALAGELIERPLATTQLKAGLYSCRMLGSSPPLTHRLVLTK